MAQSRKTWLLSGPGHDTPHWWRTRSENKASFSNRILFWKARKGGYSLASSRIIENYGPSPLKNSHVHNRCSVASQKMHTPLHVTPGVMLSNPYSLVHL